MPGVVTCRCLPYLLSVTTKHGIYEFDAMRQSGRDDVTGPGRGNHCES